MLDPVATPQTSLQYLIRCPKCRFENYGMNVALGICTWCGFDINNPQSYRGIDNAK